MILHILRTNIYLCLHKARFFTFYEPTYLHKARFFPFYEPTYIYTKHDSSHSTNQHISMFTQSTILHILRTNISTQSMILHILRTNIYLHKARFFTFYEPTYIYTKHDSSHSTNQHISMFTQSTILHILRTNISTQSMILHILQTNIYLS